MNPFTIENKHKRKPDPQTQQTLRELEHLYGGGEDVEHREDLFHPERYVAPKPVEVTPERVRQQITNGGRPTRHI